MKTRFLLSSGIAALALVACSGQQQPQNLESLLQNPLFAEQYADEIVQSMVEIKLSQDDTLQEEPDMEGVIDNLRQTWNARANEATKQQREGRSGDFIPIKEYVRGEVLVKDARLYLGPQFEMVPGPAIHLYYTTTVDPRDVEFPDETAIDLGEIQSPYGTQTYELPVLENPITYRTVVLWDTTLERLYGFAQISER
jgi:hypothetical protein